MRGGDQAMYLRSGLAVQHWLAAHAGALWLPLGAAFVLSHALLYWSMTESCLVAILGGLSALTIRHSLGGDYWGFDGPSAVGPRTLQSILVPLALLLPGGWALVALVHPGTVWNVAARWSADMRRILRPVPISVRSLRETSLPSCRLTPADQTSEPTPSVAREAILWRFAYLFFPIERRTLLSVAAHLSLPLTVWVWMGAPRLGFVLAAVASAVVGTATIQAYSKLTNRPPLDIQQLRAFRLIYPVLCAGFALAYAHGHYWLLPLALIPPAWIVSLAARVVGVRDAQPHLPGDDEVEGRWFKDGALAYLAGPGAMVAWYGRKP